MPPSRLGQAWITAADELGLHVAAPAQVSFRGTSYDCDALIEGFGSPRGTAVFALSLQPTLLNRDEGDPYCSLLSEGYSQFNRELFVGALDDWGWFGDEEPPDWYRKDWD